MFPREHESAAAEAIPRMADMARIFTPLPDKPDHAGLEVEAYLRKHADFQSFLEDRD